MSETLVPRPAFDIVVVGGSLGSLEPIRTLLRALPKDFPIPVVVATHRSLTSPDVMPLLLGRGASIHVKAAVDNEHLEPGVAYITPPGTHVRVTRAREIRVEAGARVGLFRPSINQLFYSAAGSFASRALAVVMSGRFDDGSCGASVIADSGGVVIAQAPTSAHAPSMPRAVIDNRSARYALYPDMIARAVISLTMVAGARALFSAQRLSA